jgi:hypothetical protein
VIFSKRFFGAACFGRRDIASASSKVIRRRKRSEIEKTERENKVRGAIAQHKRIGSKIN